MLIVGWVERSDISFSAVLVRVGKDGGRGGCLGVEFSFLIHVQLLEVLMCRRAWHSWKRCRLEDIKIVWLLFFAVFMLLAWWSGDSDWTCAYQG